MVTKERACSSYGIKCLKRDCMPSTKAMPFAILIFHTYWLI